jgi:hypothetical protein
LKLESALTSIGSIYLEKKGLHISSHLKMAISASNVPIGRFRNRHNTAYRNLSGESRSVPPKYQRGGGNASKVSSPKKGKFQLHFLVVADGQHLCMANAALETE